MQFMTLFSRHPDKGETSTPADLRKAEFEMIRGLYAAGLVRQIWLRGDAGGACAIVEAASTDEVAEKFSALPLIREGYLQPPMIVPLKPPYSGFAPRA
jgi:muconolactone delta-isomerase